MFHFVLIAVISACTTATEPAPPVGATVVETHQTQAPRADAPAPDNRDSFELSTGTDGTSVKYKADGTSGGVNTTDKGTTIDVKVGN